MAISRGALWAAERLQVEDIDTATMTDFFAGQKLTVGSSGCLAESYVREQEMLDGMIN